MIPSPPPPPLSYLGSRPILRGQNTVPVPFLGLSLLHNPTETLAMQATDLFTSAPTGKAFKNEYTVTVYV